MLLFLLILLLLLLIGGLLLTPVSLEADTRIMAAVLDWKHLLTLRLSYINGKGWLHLHTALFDRRWRLGDGAGSAHRQEGSQGKKPGSRQKKKTSVIDRLHRCIRVITTFRVIHLDIALDTGDPICNAYLYPLNFYPYPAGKTVRINFQDENYLHVRMKNYPARIVAAWIGWV